MQELDLSLVIACYNKEPILEESVKQVIEILDNTRLAYEIIFVDDCSRDNTKGIIDNLITKYKDKNIKKIFHDKNIGLGGAVSDGFRIAKGRIIGFIDIDLEIHARYIPSCVLAINNGFDVATAIRIYKFHFHFKSIVRYLMSKGYIWLVRRLLKMKLRDTQTGFKFFKRVKILSLLEEIEDQRWFWDTEVMTRCYLKKYKIIEIPCLYLRQYCRPSSVNDIKDSIEQFRKLWRLRKMLKRGL